MPSTAFFRTGSRHGARRKTSAEPPIYGPTLGPRYHEQNGRKTRVEATSQALFPGRGLTQEPFTR